MSVKILIVFICTAVGTAAGYFVRNRSSRRDAAASVLGAAAIDSAQLKKNVAEYIAYTGGKADKPTLSRGFLSAGTYARVCELFYSLGKSDGNSQLDELEMFLKTFGDMRAAAETKCKKQGAVAVKLGFLLGLGVVVLTL